MDAETFDRVVRRFAAVGSRRRLVGAAVAGLAAGGLVAAWRRGPSVLAQDGEAGATPVVPLPEMVGPLDVMSPCTDFILAGGPYPTDPLQVDDDLAVFLNDAPIFVDEDGSTNILAPIAFQATQGDLLTVVARDLASCRKIGPLWLHCVTTNEARFLSAGVDDGCVPDRPVPADFFQESWAI